MRTLALLPLLAIACSSPPQVNVDYDKKHTFRTQGTYAWSKGKPAASELNEDRIIAAVDEALAERGFRKLEQGKPDIHVSTEAGRTTRIQSSGSSVGVGMSRGGRHGRVGVGTSTGSSVREIPVGTLAITITDAKTNKVIWRATASDTMSGDAEDNAKSIRKAVAMAFESYPPE